jgi:uncharacterized protein with GYD domain
MATRVNRYRYTSQGFKDIKDALKRVEAALKATEAAGGKIKEVLWLEDGYDLLVIGEEIDEYAGTVLNLSIVKQGNVTAQVTRGFTMDEMKQILAKVA